MIRFSVDDFVNMQGEEQLTISLESGIEEISALNNEFASNEDIISPDFGEQFPAYKSFVGLNEDEVVEKLLGFAELQNRQFKFYFGQEAKIIFNENIETLDTQSALSNFIVLHKNTPYVMVIEDKSAPLEILDSYGMFLFVRQL